jgi:hypothetical protein
MALCLDYESLHSAYLGLHNILCHWKQSLYPFAMLSILNDEGNPMAGAVQPSSLLASLYL